MLLIALTVSLSAASHKIGTFAVDYVRGSASAKRGAETQLSSTPVDLIRHRTSESVIDQGRVACNRTLTTGLASLLPGLGYGLPIHFGVTGTSVVISLSISISAEASQSRIPR